MTLFGKRRVRKPDTTLSLLFRKRGSIRAKLNHKASLVRRSEREVKRNLFHNNFLDAYEDENYEIMSNYDSC